MRWARAKILEILLAAAMVCPAFGLGTSEPRAAAATTGSRTPPAIVDALGRSVALEKAPRRIVVAGRAVVFIVNALYLFPNAGERIIGVGVTDQGLGDFYPFLDPRWSDKKRIPNDAGAEQIASLHPDLVILKSYMREKPGSSLESIGIPVLYVDLESPERFAEDIQMLGDLLGEQARAREVIDYYESKVSLVARKVAGKARPSVLVASYSERDGVKAFSIPPAQWIQTVIVEKAGGEPVWTRSASAQGSIKVSLEQIAAWNPDFAFIVSYQKPASAVVKDLAASREWQQLRAAARGGLAAFPADYYSWDQADTRWILGLLWAAGTLHPELRGELDLRQEVLEFYKTLYGLDSRLIESEVLPRLAGSLW